MPSGFLVQLLLPLLDNHKNRFDERYYRQVRDELTERFGGVTMYSRAPAIGLWDEGDDVDLDDIVVYEVMTETLDRSWWSAYRSKLEAAFSQDEIVVRALPDERL